jgi:hypothetical protein
MRMPISLTQVGKVVSALCGGLLVVCILPAVSAGGVPQSKNSINFNRDIRPILSDRCFACHGPDKNKRQSDLRLDTKKGLFEPLAKHSDRRAIVPGNVPESFAYQRITSTDPKEVMPPTSVPYL